MSYDVFAEDLFVGRVVSMDRETGKLSIVIIEGGDQAERGEHAGKNIDLTLPAGQLPRHLLPGSVVRIWGSLSRETGAFKATHLHSPGAGAYGKDPTGVRRRIGKSRGQYGGRGGGKGRGRH